MGAISMLSDKETQAKEVRLHNSVATKCKLQVIKVEKLLGYPEERNMAISHPSD